MESFSKAIAEISPSKWFFAMGLGFSILVTLWVVHHFIQGRLEKRAPLTKTAGDDLLLALMKSMKKIFFFAIALYAALISLGLPPNWMKILEKAAILIALFQFAIWANVGAGFWVNRYLRKKAEADAESATTIGLISFAIKALIFVTTVLLVLNNLGVNITALVAGLGVGGVAVALALQNILGDLFASLTIVLDKPFIVGDFIIVGEYMGTIEHIGLKTTRIRSLSGEQLIFANGDLLQSRIRNYKRMSQRRVVFTLRLPLQTPAEALRAVPSIVKGIVEKQNLTRFDRCHFLTYGESSLNFEIVYWINSADFNTYADIAQAVNLEIFSAFAEKNIAFAYPTQTIFVQKESHPT